MSSLSPFHTAPPWQRALQSGAGVASIGFHALLALFFAVNPEPAKKAAEWVQVQVQQKAPEPPPPPPPAPEPPKEKPKPVKFQDIPPVPTPPPPDVAPTPAPPRRVQGLSANSFSASGTSGLSVRAGNTTQAPADGKGLALDEPAPRAWAAVTTRPKMSFKPEFKETEEARKAGVDGTVQVRLDISDTGVVTSVKVVSAPLGYGVDEACAAAWRSSKWKPAMQDGQPVAVTGMPQYCVVAPNL